MLLDKLKSEAESALKNRNYQHRELSETQRQELADKSWDHLTTEQKTLVAQSWAKFLGRPEGTFPTPEEARDLKFYRFLAQTNLFFLCHILEKYLQTSQREHQWFDGKKWVVNNTHEQICNQFFVSKDPANYLSFEEFANSYTDLKERMLLVPRGGFKSSIDIADCIQWIICFPEVSIAILTGRLDLATDFVGELKAHVTLELVPGTEDSYRPRLIKDKESGEYTGSIFQVLFPEHCILPNTGTQTEYQSPACVAGDREPTVRAAGIEQGLSGSHFCILKLDDVVTNVNSQTLTAMAKINAFISVNKALMHPFGFFDVIGTWYAEQDFYGVAIAYEEELKRQGDSPTVYIHLRPCWWPNQAALEAGKIEDELKKEDLILWFPERLSYEWLLKESKKDPIGFAIKYLNDPRKAHSVKFPMELLHRCTLPHNQLPPQGFIVTVVDTAYSVERWADYTVIMTAIIWGGKFYVVNMVRGRFNEYDLPVMVAQTINLWKPKRVSIEESVGVKWFGRELKREMDKLQISVPITYASLGQGGKATSKAMKAKPVLRLMGDGRMYFSNSCAGLEEIKKELSQFTGTKDDTHDDIVSAVSLLVQEFGSYAECEGRDTVTRAQYAFVADEKSRDMYDRLYAMGRYAGSSQQDDNPRTQFQTENVQLGADQEVDPLADLF